MTINGDTGTLKDQIWQRLKTVPYPGYARDIVAFGLVARVAECDGVAAVSLAIAHLAPTVQDQIAQAVRSAVEALPGVRMLNLEVGQPAAARPQATASGVVRPDVRRVIAVGSGKGGVGKSTVAVNLAAALVQQGLKAGLMDADVYGPNVPRMLGIRELPPSHNGKIVPAQAQGLQVVSAGLLVDPRKAVIWRGPLTDKLIRQFLADVEWGTLDALVVDLPPGTGDIALSLIQHARPEGAIVVVTPQEVALDDARKAVGMFRQLGVEVLGVVENMSYFRCDECGKQHALFGEGGGRRFSQELGIPLLGQVPLEPAVREGGDQGRPAVLLPASEAGAEFKNIAARVWEHRTALQAQVPAAVARV